MLIPANTLPRVFTSQEMIPKVLVVDDQPINVHMLKRKLEKHQIAVLTASSGQECLEMVQREQPDLILLDIMMPGMDGFSVCRELQKNTRTCSIPIIFVTAKTSKEGRLEGLASGAVDYITKPIDLDETLARVQTQLRFLRINQENIRLQERLGEIRRNSAIGAITQGIAHNLNNLLGVSVGYIDLIRLNYEKPDSVLRYQKMLEDSVQRIISIIRQLTSLIEENQLPKTAVPLIKLVDEALGEFHLETKGALQVELKLDNPKRVLSTQREVMVESLKRILMNAWESYGSEASPEKRKIVLSTEVEKIGHEEELLFIIKDFGRGIDPSIADNIFDPFVSTKQNVGIGMGLTMVRHGMRNLGGEVFLKANLNEPGVSAILRHPLD